MKKVFVMLLMLAVIFVIAGCRADDNAEGETGKEENQYVSISQEEAKNLMDTESDYVILDVRTKEEYDEEHIPEAVQLPDYEVAEKAEEVLEDKDGLILVYCRSGNRSKRASQILAEKGYTNVKEFGGITTWPYETI